MSRVLTSCCAIWTLELEITRHAIQLREVSLDLIQLRVDNGYSSEIDLREAEVLVKSARTALTSLELRDRSRPKISSPLLLGRNPGPIVPRPFLAGTGIGSHVSSWLAVHAAGHAGPTSVRRSSN